MISKTTRKEFQVALLMDDVVEAKTISDGLREIGIFAHFYQDLDELWVSLNSETPDFCIVDVKKMSQGSLLFKQHPKVKNNTLKFSFYYKDSTQVLLNSTFGLNHYGLIRAELSLVDQLKSVLLRRNEELRLIEENETMRARVSRLKLRSVRLTEQQEKDNISKGQMKVCNNLISKFGKTNTLGDFNKRLVYLFSGWDECLEFGVYQLNSTNQKLVSLKSRQPKFKTLPDLWLSHPCEQGISAFARDMAYDVCYGVMEGELISLNISGLNDDPSLILVGKFNSEAVSDFNWSILENKISSEYRKVLLAQESGEQHHSHADSIFTTLQNLDDIHFHQVDLTHRYALIDFSNLVTMIKQRSSNRFYWKAFMSEFSNELSDVLSGDYRISNYGAEAFLIGIDKKNIELDFNKLKAYVEDFQFWRYFEDSSIVVSNDLSPEVRFIAPSSVNMIRQMQDGFSNFMNPEPEPILRRRQLEV